MTKTLKFTSQDKLWLRALKIDPEAAPLALDDAALNRQLREDLAATEQELATETRLREGAMAAYQRVDAECAGVRRLLKRAKRAFHLATLAAAVLLGSLAVVLSAVIYTQP